MGQAIVKCARDRDLYLIWSSIVDNAIWVFDNREELVKHLVDEGYSSPGASVRRADENGSSDRAIRFAWWDDDELQVMEGAPPCPDGPDGYWSIRREHLTAYAEAILAAEDDAALAVAGHDLMHWEEWE